MISRRSTLEWTAALAPAVLFSSLARAEDPLKRGFVSIGPVGEAG